MILDRRLSQDDNRGLGEPLKDNKRTESKFFILVEEKTTAGDNVRVSKSLSCITFMVSYHHSFVHVFIHLTSASTSLHSSG